MESNGRVFLINPNGVLFGAASRVDVNGLVASSLQISNSDFLAGKMNFSAGAVAGRVGQPGPDLDARRRPGDPDSAAG